ncbi:MAG: rhamnan synthesis F family protein [Lachnospiraceae bacterium]
MNRIGMIVIYDDDGIIDTYVEYLLQSLSVLLQKMVLVINGSLTEPSLEILKKYSKDIYQRENTGFDGGAYKDAITKYLSKEDWSQWDELILLNDTFYGPLYPWEQVFQVMDRENVDYWGLNRYSGDDRKKQDGTRVPEFIHSYFLVCRAVILRDPAFADFWQELEYPGTWTEATEFFEIGISEYLSKLGYRSTSYAEVVCPKYRSSDYSSESFELIVRAKLPIVKRKALSLIYHSQAEHIMHYIDTETDYDIELIRTNMQRWERQNGKIFSREELVRFCRLHKKIYIYGRGKYAGVITEYLKSRQIVPVQYLVTKDCEQYENTINFKDLILEPLDGIVVALGRTAFREVFPILQAENLDKSQLLLPRL